ncbi:MAG: glycosyltransferase [Blastochloris sp.]|nr:glycosyltransferase [Blastochloris sp.]
MLEAIERLGRMGRGDVEFLIIGDGAQRAALLKAREANARLHWIPYCSDPVQLADYYRAADLFVHPGVCETFGLVALESQACGCPVVGIRGSYMDANIFSGLEFWAQKTQRRIWLRRWRDFWNWIWKRWVRSPAGGCGSVMVGRRSLGGFGNCIAWRLSGRGKASSTGRYIGRMGFCHE